MKLRAIRWLWILGLLAAASPFAPALGQIEGSLSSYTGQNAEGYLKPLQEGFGSALQDAWFRSAHVPKSGFHINVELKSMFVKFGDDDRTFMATTEEGFYPETTTKAPTVIGDTTAVEVNGTGGLTSYFPAGFDIGSLGVASPQITIGSLYGTQAVFRYIAVDTGDAEIGDLSLLGLGARHSISQYLTDPPVDISVGIFWQKFELGEDLIDATALSFGAQVGRRYGVVEPYLGLSYDTFGMSVKYESDAVDEVLDVDFDSESNLHITAGLGLNFSVVHLHGELSSASQTSFAVGLSVGN